MAKFIISAFSDECGEASLSGQIAACKANGITHMELRGFGGELNINTLSASQAKEMKRELDDSGMYVGSIGSGYGKINIKEDFAPHFEAFKRTIEVANILAAPYIRLFSFYFDADDSHAAQRELVFSQVQKMADYACANGVQACHENEKGIYGDNAARCKEILTEVPELAGVFVGEVALQQPRLPHEEGLDALGTVAPAGKEVHVGGFGQQLEGETVGLAPEIVSQQPVAALLPVAVTLVEKTLHGVAFPLQPLEQQAVEGAVEIELGDGREAVGTSC